MKLMYIGFFEIRNGEKEYLEKGLSDNQLFFSENIITPEILSKHSDLEILSTHSGSKITAEVINSLPNLKLIAARTTGTDHIDLKAAQEKGIMICNIPAYGEITVAEYTFALILALSRKIIPAYQRIHTDHKFSTGGLQGFDLNGKTIGIIGTGRIGQHVIKIAGGFKMKIIAQDAFPKESLQNELNFRYVGLDELLSQSDIVSIHIPLTKESQYLINIDNISQFKKGALLINTSRGGVVETAAVLRGIDEGILSGAGLDVFEEEKDVTEDRTLPEDQTLRLLLEKENVIITPHNAFNTVESEQRILATTVKNITAFESGSPQNLVTLP